MSTGPDGQKSGINLSVRDIQDILAGVQAMNRDAITAAASAQNADTKPAEASDPAPPLTAGCGGLFACGSW